MSLLRRALLARLARNGVGPDEIERTMARVRAEGRELTVAERDHLSKLKWARERGMADTVGEEYAEARMARAEQWIGWDQAPPASDDWLLRPDQDDDDPYKGLYIPPNPYEQIYRDAGLVWDV